MFRTSFGFQMLHKARRRARLKALKKKKEKKLARYHAHLNKITTLNAVDSPLLRLPAELRNAIFAYVYAGTEYYFDDGGRLRFWNSEEDSDKPVCLSFVCRQTHAETSLLPYKLGMFEISSGGVTGRELLGPLETFLASRSPEQINATVTLKFENGSSHWGSYWYQTRTAAYWVAKLESLDADAAKMHWVELETFDEHFVISSLGSSD